MTITEGEIIPFPNIEDDQTDALFIAGPRGSGKSYITSTYTEVYKKIFPKNKIYLFSTKPYDECLDKLKPIRVEINDELIEEPITLDELKNSLVIFDDIDSIADKDIKSELFRLYNLILQNGRSYKITVIITYHNITDYKMTRETLNNSSHCIIFPQSGATAQNKYMLKTYCGLEKHQIDKIMGLNSRWVMIKKYAPMMVIYQKGVYFL
jgi:energy-coupling factor transporter ATP-binding protein EcfA2